MAQKLYISLQILCIILTTYMVKSDSYAGDELTLRNQLLADIIILKEGVDHLQISVEVLNKRYSNQIDMLKHIQLNIGADGDEDNCFNIGSALNTTNRKLNSFEFKILNKLEQIQDEQTTLLDHIKLKKNSEKTCSPQDESSVILSTMSPVLSDINKKVDGVTQKLVQLEAMEEMFKSQQSKFELYNQDQSKILEDINAKLTKNQDQFEMLEKELSIIKDMFKKMDRVVHKEPTKMSMKYLLGLTTANLTKS